MFTKREIINAARELFKISCLIADRLEIEIEESERVLGGNNKRDRELLHTFDKVSKPFLDGSILD
jgi:hypothetical protein